MRVLNEKREELIERLKKLEIEVGIHFIPVHKHSQFADAPKGDMTVTEKVVKEVLTLPLHSNVKREFIERIVKRVLSFFN